MNPMVLRCDKYTGNRLQLYARSSSLKSSKQCNFLFHISNYIHQDAVGRNIHCQLFFESPLVGLIQFQVLYKQRVIQLAKYIYMYASCPVQLVFFFFFLIQN